VFASSWQGGVTLAFQSPVTCTHLHTCSHPDPGDLAQACGLNLLLCFLSTFSHVLSLPYVSELDRDFPLRPLSWCCHFCLSSSELLTAGYSGLEETKRHSHNSTFLFSTYNSPVRVIPNTKTKNKAILFLAGSVVSSQHQVFDHSLNILLLTSASSRLSTTSSSNRNGCCHHRTGSGAPLTFPPQLLIFLWPTAQLDWLIPA